MPGHLGRAERGKPERSHPAPHPHTLYKASVWYKSPWEPAPLKTSQNKTHPPLSQLTSKVLGAAGGQGLRSTRVQDPQFQRQSFKEAEEFPGLFSPKKQLGSQASVSVPFLSPLHPLPMKQPADHVPCDNVPVQTSSAKTRIPLNILLQRACPCMIQVPCDLYLEFMGNLKSTEMLIFCRKEEGQKKKKGTRKGTDIRGNHPN